jgi:hypothetical protein
MWYVDASFAVHPNMRGHTGGCLTMGCRFPISVSNKQKLNTKSSTESELVGVNDMMTIIIWTHYFLLEQGYRVVENLLLQDNKSLILLERNGKTSRVSAQGTSISLYLHHRSSQHEGGYH